MRKRNPVFKQNRDFIIAMKAKGYSVGLYKGRVLIIK